MPILDLEPDRGVKKRKGIPQDLKARHAAALDQFKASASYFSKQRQREVDDLRFVDFDEQWDPTVKTQRAGNQAVNGQPPTPARPTVVINQLRAPCQQVANMRRNARLALTFSPKGGGATDDVAQVFEDIVRAAQHESRAAIARNWAADRAEKCGMGWYRIDTDWANESDDDPAAYRDLDLVWRRILNQASVYPDQTAQEPDFSDGRRLFVTEDIPIDRYQVDHPDSDLSDYDASELVGIGDAQPNLVFPTSADGEQGTTVRIAELWEVVESERVKVMRSDGSIGYEDEPLPEGVTVASGQDALRRRVKHRKIMWSKINAVEFLEGPVEWNGQYIPIIPCVGEESNINGERRWQGIVRPGKDAAVSYNVMRSAQIEAIALATKAPYIGFMETIEPYLEWWKNSAVRNYFILPIKAAYDKAGNLLPAPQRTVQEPAIQAMTMAAQAAKDDVHTTTGIPPVALGQLDPHDRSGKAIQALQGQAEVGSSGYLDNFVEITLALEGKVVRDAIPRIFDREGRIVPALGLDEKRRMVMLNYPFVEGPDGQPVKALQGWTKGQPVPPQIQGPDGKPMKVQYYDLSAGQFSVVPTVGKSFATKRKEVNDSIQNIMQVVAPEMAMALAPAFIESLDTPDALKLAEIAKKALPPQLAAAYQDDKSGPTPEVQQLQQQLQQATQALQSGVAQEQAKQQAQSQRELQKAQLDQQTAIQKAQIDAQTRIQVAKINAQASLTEASIKVGAADTGHQVARDEQLIGNDHELRVQAIDHEQERQMAAVEHQQAIEQSEQAQAHALEQVDQGAVIASQQAEQQATLNPPQVSA